MSDLTTVDDGFTIQCERCHVWQHAACFSIPSIDAVPDVYLCDRCHPYPSTHRQLHYEGARRLQQQRLGLAGKNVGTLGLENSGAVIGAGVGPPTPAVRGGARKRRTGSPKVERKTRGGASGAARRRGSSATSHPHASADDASGNGGGRKVAAASGRRKELESSANTTALQHHQRQNPLHPSHQNNTMDPPFTAAQQPPHQPATHSHSFAPLDCTQNANKPWTQQYVPITRDIVHPAVQPVLRSFAHTWRGVTAFSDAETNTNDELSPLTSCIPMPAPTLPTDDTPTTDTRKTFLHPLSSPLTPPVRPPTYTLHALRPIARQSYVVPYTCAITPSREYLREPTSQYAQVSFLHHTPRRLASGLVSNLCVTPTDSASPIISSEFQNKVCISCHRRLSCVLMRVGLVGRAVGCGVGVTQMRFCGPSCVSGGSRRVRGKG